MDDFVRDMGLLCLGSRLKRLGERLQADVQQHLDKEGFEIQTSHTALIAALDRYGPLSIGDLVEALGVSQPGVTRSVTKLAADGLVVIVRMNADQRKKTVSLTAKGQQLTDRLRVEAWPLIEGGVADLCGNQSHNVLTQLSAIEDRLDDRSLCNRIMDQPEEAGS